MTRIANPFRYMFREPYASSGAIYKAWFGKKYLIWKAKSLHQSVNTISKEIDQRMRLGLKPDDPFTKAVEHIRRARVTIFEVEAMLLSDDPSALLMEEYRLLKVAQDDPAALNMHFFPQIPKWIPDTAVAQFQKDIAALRAPKKKAAKKKAKKVSAKKDSRSKARKKTPATKLKKVIRKSKR
jgi:hypothetical protein